MMRIWPTLKIAIALVFVTCAMLVLIDSIFQVFPDPDAQVMRLRTALAQSVAVQLTVLAQKRDQQTLEEMLQAIREQTPDLRSLAVRRTDNSVVEQTADHDERWNAATGAESTLTQITVPVTIGSEHWGRLEMAFAPDQRTIVARAIEHPLWITLLSVIPLGLLFFWVYMKRTLVHLDPGSVIPERVRMAFDVMTEGIAVLDREGRVLLANNALHALHADKSIDPVGRHLSALPWLARGLAPNSAEHPWNIAMRQGRSITNQVIEVNAAGPPGRRVAINCAPILDEKGVVRGCLATFDDLSELHLANQRLSLLLADLQASQEQIERNKRELEQLATHDMLTGCLTRQAFFEYMTKAFNRARLEGTALSCVALNIDRFNSVNDTLGHAVGDRVVREVATQLLVSFRGTDVVGRCGSYEFFIGMPGCDVREAAMIVEAVRQTISQECGARVPGVAGLAINVSAGLAVLEETDANLAQLLERAHTDLYATKSAEPPRVVRKRDTASTAGSNARAAVGRLKVPASPSRSPWSRLNKRAS